jgi:fido (protein-threonine AMPylation protein)
MALRPHTEEELQKREAIGVIRASRFVRRYANSHGPIDMNTVREIHNEIFKDAWPEIAGKYRKENLKITESRHMPPHYSNVDALMTQADQVFTEHLKKLRKMDGAVFTKSEATTTGLRSIDAIISSAAWVHHTITFVHPFREGNGRTARLAANLLLERYGLVGISIKIEKENKNRYRQALAQIDLMQDYEPLKAIIYEGLIERYNGVTMKYYAG